MPYKNEQKKYNQKPLKDEQYPSGCYASPKINIT
jgi:hypothetical protein